jgi:hypothetical protein
VRKYMVKVRVEWEGPAYRPPNAFNVYEEPFYRAGSSSEGRSARGENWTDPNERGLGWHVSLYEPRGVFHLEKLHLKKAEALKMAKQWVSGGKGQ